MPRIKRTTLAIALGLLVFATVAVIAPQIRATAAPYDGPGFVSVTAAAFQPQHEDEEYFNRDSTLTTGSGYPPDSHRRAKFTAPVELPHGATITGMTIYCKDNSPSGSEGVQLHLLRRNMRAGTTNVVMRMNDPTGTEHAKPTASLAEVDNSAYGYYFTLYLQSDTTFFGVLVEYEYAGNLPLALRNG